MDKTTEMSIGRCWCTSGDLEAFSDHYYKCRACNTLISTHHKSKEFYRGSDDANSLYGKDYWLKHVKEDFGYPDITERSRNDLAERSVYWLRAILKYKLPPVKTLELGCSPGGLVFLMKLTGYQATGSEMSQWICDYAHKTFDIPMLCGPIEDLNIPPNSLDAVILMDVLEHMPDPVGSLNRIADILKDDGIVVIQTPCWRETEKTYDEMKADNNIFLTHFKEEEHLYLFSEKAIKRLLSKSGFHYIEFEKAIFPYDMFIFAGKKPLLKIGRDLVETALIENPQGRLALALIDFYEKLDKKDNFLSLCEADREARLEVIQRQEREFTKRLEESEADRAARLEAINKLSVQLQECEADRAAKLKVIENLDSLLQVKEQELSNKKKEIEEMKLSLSWKVTTPLRWLSKHKPSREIK